MDPAEVTGRAYDPAAFRSLAQGLVDLAERWIGVGEDEPQTTSLDPAGAWGRLDQELPRSGTGAEVLLERLGRDVVGEGHRLAHPRYVGHQVAPPIPAAAAVDLLIATMNNGMAVWEMSPTATVIEHTVLAWFAGELGWPGRHPSERTWGGAFVSGGAVGNLTGLAAARARLWPDAWIQGNGARPVAIVVSDQAHYCVERAAGLMGLGRDALVTVPSRRGRMDPDAAAQALTRARSEGRDLLALVATAGTTATGAVDDLEALGQVARDHDTWFHVDAAHGGAFLLSPRLRPLLAGLERADSLALDLHKMMFQPISTALVLCRERKRLSAAFHQDAPYLFGSDDREALNLGALTLQCSKRADALRAWATLNLLGADGVAALQEHTVDTARTAHAMLVERPDFETFHAPQTNILCFRHRPPHLAGDEEALDRHNDGLRETLRSERFAYLSGTTLDGRRVLRMTFINPRTGADQVARILDRIEAS